MSRFARWLSGGICGWFGGKARVLNSRSSAMNDSSFVFAYGRVEMMDAAIDVDKGEGGKRKARSG
jgi:hypothetical protein